MIPTLDAKQAPRRERRLLPRVFAIVGLAVVAIIALWVSPPIPQSTNYHRFADNRTLLGMPNLLNVISNLPFLIVGFWGVWFVLRQNERSDGPFLDPVERWPFVLFFVGVGLTALGSAYYHLHPENDRLLWDRLPMSLSFMSLFASVIAERIDVKAGIRLLFPLAAVGIASVLYWHWTERFGHGDLRPYYFVQFYPMLALPLMLLLFPPRYTRTIDLCLALGWYVLAKVCEHPGDGPIYDLGHLISGHTLKHLAAAAGAYWILRMVQKRRPRVAAP